MITKALASRTEKIIPTKAKTVSAEKAFDKVNWKFLLKVLEKFGFGELFIGWIKTLYTAPRGCCTFVPVGHCTNQSLCHLNSFCLSTFLTHYCSLVASIDSVLLCSALFLFLVSSIVLFAFCSIYSGS